MLMNGSRLAADLLAVAIAVAIPLTGPLERRAYRANPETPLKLLVYGANFVLLWALTAAAVWIEGWGPLLQSPSAGVAWLWSPAISSPALCAVSGAYIVVALLPFVQSLRGLRWRRAYAGAYRRGFAEIPGLLPNTAVERTAWVFLSLTAGTCEEVLLRGFLIRFLHEGGLGMSLAVALVVSAMIFGLAHVYQGFKGVAGTALGGLVFGLIFLLSGSLIPGIVLHVLVDLQVAYVLRPVPDDVAAALETA
jgi:membrane protease YdiL (CAAX protease family)